MSFILDALRKSEHERQRSTLPGLAQVPLATPPAQVPRWVFVVIGVLVAAVLVLGGAWWQSTRTPVGLAASPPMVERPVPLPPPAASPPASPALAERAGTQRLSPPEPARSASGNGLATAAAPSSPATAAEEPSFAGSGERTTADDVALPSATALLAEGISLPVMRLELLAFRDQPRDRFVFINGRKYVEGERLIEGPQLQSITRTGAVLTYAGRRFLLVAE